MPHRRLAFLLLAVFPIAEPAWAQQPQRDAQAVVVLQRAFTAMGGRAPTDSVATGSIELLEGSKTETGTIRILNRGLDQSAEHIGMRSGNRSLIYSRGEANGVLGTTVKAFTLELASSSQSPEFPLILIAAALTNSDSAFQYLGTETVGGIQAHHMRYWNTYGSSPKLRNLAEFSVKDVWVGVVSGLPLKLGYDRRNGGGAESRVPLAVFYGDYRNVGGVLYPFLIQKSLNGTPWTTITIQSVSFNTGLTDTDFPVQ